MSGKRDEKGKFMSKEASQAEAAAALADVDTEKASELLAELTMLDAALRDNGSSLSALLRILAHTAAGIRNL